MKSEVPAKSASLYDTDYLLWIEETVAKLRSQDFNTIDLENLIEEIESLGKSDRRAIVSYLRRLCEHLLKIQYWESERENCFRAWKLEVRNFRLQIQAIFKDSPSLQNYLKENFTPAYHEGRRLFLDESDLNPGFIPSEPKFTLEQALAQDWLPWQPNVEQNGA